VARGWAGIIARVTVRPQSEDRLRADVIGREDTRRALPEWAFDDGHESGEERRSEDRTEKKRWGQGRKYASQQETRRDPAKHPALKEIIDPAGSDEVLFEVPLL
jgi:hypothetical protein